METIEQYKDVNAIINKDLVMIIAKTHTCSTCKSIHNLLENNLEHYSKIEKYAIYIDDIDLFRGEHLIFSVPTIIIFSKGKELLRESRYFNYNKIDRLIEMFEI